MITGVTVKASAQRLALWKRVAARGCVIGKLTVTGLMPLAPATMALSALPAQAATAIQSPLSSHVMWTTRTAVRFSWPASPGAALYAYQLSQMNGVRARSGQLPGFDHTVICRGLHPGWRYRVQVRADPGGSGTGWYATASVTLPSPNPPREVAYRWAETQAGARYRYGGQGDGGYDCSGLVRTAYQHAGIWLPRTTGEMLQYRRLDEESSPRQGDLVFFGTGHVELYAGPDQSFGAETNRTGTWWNRWWPGNWWPTAFYRVSGAD
jgi:cell wall-associated NlpC family hydrolase